MVEKIDMDGIFENDNSRMYSVDQNFNNDLKLYTISKRHAKNISE